jgi:ABC-type uncharacterized transport system involved in gliding motility auxiliary subunit
MRVNIPKLSLVKLFNLEGLQKTSIYLISLAIFIVFNFLISYLPYRLDFSSGKAHTLSNSTKKIISKLDDIVNIKVFISSDLPLRLLPLKTDVVDLVNEYKKQGKGKIIVKNFDPKKDEKAQNEVKDLGIPELQFSQIEKDKYAVSATYFGMAIQYGDKKEIIPQATNLGSLEYDITSSIYKMTRKEAIKIGLLGGENSSNPQQDEFYTAKKILQQQFELSSLDLSSDSKTKIDSSVKALLVFDDSKKQYSTNEAEMIKDYINNKGKAIFMVDGTYVDERLITQPATHNLFSVFESYGVNLNKNLVLSSSSELASFTTGAVSFFTPYPFWVKTTNFSDKSAEFSNIGFLTFPWVSSLDVNKKNSVETTVLVKSEKNSWEQKDNFTLMPDNIASPTQNELKQFNLIIEVKEKNGGQFVLIPSSRFIKEQFLTRGQANMAFLLNLINNYASQGALAGIRSRSIFIAPIQDVPEDTKDLIKYLNILLLPGLFGLFGGARLLKRK